MHVHGAKALTWLSAAGLTSFGSFRKWLPPALQNLENLPGFLRFMRLGYSHFLINLKTKFYGSVP